MNNAPENNNSTIKDKLGLATGLLIAFIWIMPVYSYTKPYFAEQVLHYIPYGMEFMCSIVWMVCLFFFIVSAVRFAVSAVIHIIAIFLSMLSVKYTLWRSARRYK